MVYLLDYLQVLQNRAARAVTRNGWRTPRHYLLLQCGWLSVHQLVIYHSLVLVFQIKQKERPRYFRNHFSAGFPYRTRLATSEGIRRREHCQHKVTQESFVQRSSSSWNMLPVSVRNARTHQQFKNRLKSWIRDNVPL